MMRTWAEYTLDVFDPNPTLEQIYVQCCQAAGVKRRFASLLDHMRDRSNATAERVVFEKSGDCWIFSVFYSDGSMFGMMHGDKHGD
jgi:hypothetical protein